MQIAKRNWASIFARVALIVTAAICVSGSVTSAHVLDEYQQAAQISIDPHAITVDLYLTPGVEVFPYVLKKIDTNGDGMISPDEGNAYAHQVLSAMSLSIDGKATPMTFVTCDYPAMHELKGGLGEIHVQAMVNAPQTGGTQHVVHFENHLEPEISEYSANAMLPKDSRITIGAQNRNATQSAIDINYDVAGSAANISMVRHSIGAVLLAIAGSLALLGLGAGFLVSRKNSRTQR